MRDSEARAEVTVFGSLGVGRKKRGSGARYAFGGQAVVVSYGVSKPQCATGNNARTDRLASRYDRAARRAKTRLEDVAENVYGQTKPPRRKIKAAMRKGWELPLLA